MDRIPRRAGEIAQMDSKIVMSLETEEDILKDTESALLFQDNNKETPVSQFHHSSYSYGRYGRKS